MRANQNYVLKRLHPKDSMADPQKIINRITIWCDNTISGVHSKEMKAQIVTETCTPLFTAVWFTTAKSGSKQVSLNTWMGSIHTVEHYWTLKWQEILTQATWMHLEDIVLSGLNQWQKDKSCITPLLWGAWSHQILGGKVGRWVPGGEMGNYGLTGRVPIWEDGKSEDGRWGCLYNTVNVSNAAELCI